VVITASNITDEQIDALWREACGPGPHQDADADTMHLCVVATNRRGYHKAGEQDEARTHCAAILNARSAK